MLGALARRLRAAGHDAALAEPGAPDRELTRRAVAEGRTLLTRDRRLAVDRPADARVLVLPEGEDAQARLVRETLGLDWLAAPLTRCMVDDTPVEPESAEQAAPLPPDVRRLGPIHRCPTCGRLYWAGGHVARMRAELERLAAL